MNKTHLFGIIVLSLMLFSCGSRKNISSRKSNKLTSKDKIEKEYKRCYAIPYKYGGTTYSGFDCSGFVQHIYKKALNIKIPRSTKEQLRTGKRIKAKDLKIGDLVFFKPLKKFNHVGIFVGQNMFIHSSSSKGVMKSKLSNTYWRKYYSSSRRVANIK